MSDDLYSKRLEALFSDPTPVGAEPGQRPAGVEALQAKVAALEARLEAALSAWQPSAQPAGPQPQAAPAADGPVNDAAEAAPSAATSQVSDVTMMSSEGAAGPVEPAHDLPALADSKPRLMERAARSALNRIRAALSGALRSLAKIETTEQGASAQTTYRVMLAMLGAAGPFTLLSIGLAVFTGAWQIWTEASLMVVFCAITAYGAVLSRRGRPVQAALQMTVAMQLVMVIISGLLVGLGLTFLVMITVLSAMLAGLVLPRRWASPIIISGAVFGSAALLLDFYTPTAFRYDAPILAVTGPSLAAVLAVLYAVWGVSQFRNASLRTKLIVGFGTVVVLAVSIVTFVADRTVRRSILDQSGAQLGGISRAIAGEVVVSLSKELDLLRTLTLNHHLLQDIADEGSSGQALSPAEIEQLDQQWRAADEGDALIESVLDNHVSEELREAQERFPELAELFITNRQGLLLAAGQRTSDYYQADEEWWQAARSRGVYIGQPEFDESSGIVGMNVAVVIEGHDSDEVVGVLRATINLEPLTEPLAAGRFGRTGRAEVYFPDGREIELDQEPDGEFELELEVASLNLSALVDSSAPYLILEHDDVPTIVAQSEVAAPANAQPGDKAAFADLDWRVVALQEQAEINEIARVSVRNALVAALGAVLAAVVAAVVVARQLTRPIIRLSAATNRLAAGELNIEVPVEGTDEMGQLAGTFNAMSGRLRQTLQGLQERTRDLALAAEVGQRLSQLSGIDALLGSTVELIGQRFGLYYTQVYLLDPTGTSLVLRAGLGEVGETLLARGHRLPIDVSSINGTAALEKRPVVVPDTSKGIFMPNPLLPKTRSEMAIPLLIGEQVLGVLDLQSAQVGGLTDEHLPAFLVLAGQIAIALENSKLFAASESARLEVERLARSFTRAGWDEFLDAVHRTERLGYVYADGELQPAGEALPAAAESVLSVPLTLAGEPVGQLQVEFPMSSWDEGDAELVQTVAGQVAQQLENLRLLADAQRARTEAEDATRRLTREGWEAYLQSSQDGTAGFIYDGNQVQPLAFGSNGGDPDHSSMPVVVRGETIGELAVCHDGPLSAEDSELLAQVASQLSVHLENLRLNEQTRKRAAQLEAVAQVSTVASTLLDMGALLQTVVDLTKARFGLYHAHIYLFDDESQTLRLAAGAGEVGRQMVRTGRQISLDQQQSLVARAARGRTSLIVNDVRAEADFLPHPMLPNTRSELAVPMIAGERLVGVFDIQSSQVGRFSEEDAQIQGTLAAQLAVAVQNAQLYSEQAATVGRLRELDQMKSSFLANMSHELRTPLNSILGFAEVMLEGVDGEVTEPMENDLRIIYKNGQHLLNLINDVLDMAKIEAGRMNLAPEPFDLREVMSEVLETTKPLARAKGLGLHIEPNTPENLPLEADRGRLRQVLLNLVNNSIKFTDTGSIRLQASQADGHVHLTVRDTGVGIPPGHLESIFHEFTQVDTSTTRKAGGTGLGLPISRHLIELHGGRLWAESTGISGEGAVFHIVLPLKAGQPAGVERQHG